MLAETDLEKLRQENPRGIIHLIGKNSEWEAVFRKPKRPEYKMYRAQVHEDARRADAAEVLARQIVIFPAREAFDAMLDDFPAIPEALASDPTFKEAVGMTTEQDAKR